MDIEKRLAQLEFVHRTANVVSWVWDVRADSAQWFGDVEGLLGLRPGTHSGRFEQYLSLLHPDDAPAARRTFIECLQGRRPAYCAEERVLGRGGVRWLEAQGQAEYGPAGRAVRMCGVLRDVTERRAAEERIRELNSDLERRVLERTAQLESANRELEAFGMTVSHDLLAPVQTIRLFAQMLQEDCAAELSEKCRHLAGRIERSVLRMNDMVRALLELSRSGRVALVMRRADMNALAAESIDELRLAHRYAGEIDVAPLDPCLGDARLLRQVLQNLIGNAMKFSRHAAAPRIELRSAPCGGERVLYWVRDNGCGFDMRHAERLFDAFQRLHNPRDYEGTGVGLATVRSIVERHGGDVHAVAERGKGATFYFTLPAAAQPASILHQEVHQAGGVPAPAAACLDMGVELVDERGYR